MLRRNRVRPLPLIWTGIHGLFMSHFLLPCYQASILASMLAHFQAYSYMQTLSGNLFLYFFLRMFPHVPGEDPDFIRLPSFLFLLPGPSSYASPLNRCKQHLGWPRDGSWLIDDSMMTDHWWLMIDDWWFDDLMIDDWWLMIDDWWLVIEDWWSQCAPGSPTSTFPHHADLTKDV